MMYFILLGVANLQPSSLPPANEEDLVLIAGEFDEEDEPEEIVEE